ncbi:hypothetical protein J6590_056140 [Homalodisca vitripennis]|nr:hypothetical protein J6590_056140 [Homalodisca vitripennis]
MVDKLHEYQGCLGRLHSFRASCRARWQERKVVHTDGGQTSRVPGLSGPPLHIPGLVQSALAGTQSCTYCRKHECCFRMVDKLHEYQGCLGRLHSFRDSCRARWQEHQEGDATFADKVKSYLRGDKDQNQAQQADYSHIYR